MNKVGVTHAKEVPDLLVMTEVRQVVRVTCQQLERRCFCLMGNRITGNDFLLVERSAAVEPVAKHIVCQNVLSVDLRWKIQRAAKITLLEIILIEVFVEWIRVDSNVAQYTG